MSQPPSYVVRQDTGGKLKLLLVRDPRAVHVAKTSPIKKQPTEPLTQASPPSSTAVSSSSSSAEFRAPVATVSNPSDQRALSPASLTEAATRAMAQGGHVSSGGHRRVKGGKIVKLHNNKFSLKSPDPHSPIPDSNSTASASSRLSSDVCCPRHQTALPVSRIRTIMKTNVESSFHSPLTVSQDSVALVTKAAELFIAQLARGAHKVAMAAAERDVSYGHLATSVRREDRTEFLHDILPEKVVVRDYLALLGNQTDHTHTDASTSSSS